MENILSLIRRKRKITQSRMAEDLKVSPSYLCKVEKGTQEPSRRFMKDCSVYLDVAEGELFPNTKSAVRGRLQLDKEHYPNILWIKRQEKKLKQYELARMVGCSPSYLSRVEKGKQDPTDHFKNRCARVLRIRKTVLFPGG